MLLSALIIYSAIKPLIVRGRSLGIASTSLAALVIILVSQTVDPETIFNTLKGDQFIHPWKILTIFFSVAYVSISLDSTGALNHVALQLSKLTNRGRRLFLYVFLLTGLITIVTSNDIAILTLTPIIIYLAKYSRFNPLPYLFAQFIAANTFGMLIFTADPVNIILASSLGFTFAQYSSIMVWPTLFAASSSFILLYFIFRSEIPHRISISAPEHSIAPQKISMIISTVLIIAMLTTLLMSEHFGISIWSITLGFAAIALLKDSLLCLANKKRYASAAAVIKRLPWALLPFATFFFVVINISTNSGIFEQSISGLNEIGSLAGIISTLGTGTALASNVFNNQPATILATSLVTGSGLSVEGGLNLATFAIIIGASVGASLTLIGTLAGVMWQRILLSHNIEISYTSYLKVAIKVVPLSLIFSLFGLYLALNYVA